MLPYNKIKASTTSIMTNYSSEEIFRCLVGELDDKNVTYKVKPTAWRINYCKQRIFASSLDEENLLPFEEKAKIQIDLYDAGEGKICVQFSR